MKKSWVLLLLLITVPLAFAQGEEIFRSSYVVLDFNISSSVNIVPDSGDYKLSYVNAELSYFPAEDERQSVLEQNYIPDAKMVNNSLRFSWENVRESMLQFSINSRLRIANRPYYIPKKVAFPIGGLPKDIEEYTQPTQTIDSGDPKIISLASSLAQGEDDLFVVAFKIGNWTKNNVAYDLNSQTANVSQKASWVLDNRQGVCDELTSLFIAMLRSLGVPARFIAGYAYTSSVALGQRWGSHGWAEVYFPDYGWVPFDVTYGELGYIDASHVKLKASSDPDTSSTIYGWAGRDVSLETSPLSFSAKLVESGPQLEDKIKLTAGALHSMTGFGSYNLIEATVENPTLFYQAEEVKISKTESTEVVGSSEKLVLLRPGEKQTIYWIIGVDENLDRRYVYKFPVSVYTTSNLTADTYFQSQKGEDVFLLAEMQNYINSKAGGEQKVYTDSIEFNCSTDKAIYHIYETVQASCQLKNTGNTMLPGLRVCLKGNCTTLDLGIAQSGNVRFEFRPDGIGRAREEATAVNDKVSASSIIATEILDIPAVQITGISYPKNVTYKDRFEINFSIGRNSTALPRNAEITFSGSGISKSWNFSELDSDQRFEVEMAGSSLSAGGNVFYIGVKYYDNNNREYAAKQQLEIHLARPTLWQRIMIFLNKLF